DGDVVGALVRVASDVPAIDEDGCGSRGTGRKGEESEHRREAKRLHGSSPTGVPHEPNLPRPLPAVDDTCRSRELQEARGKARARPGVLVLEIDVGRIHAERAET